MGAIMGVLVHAILGVRPPAGKVGFGKDSQDRMHQGGDLSGEGLTGG
jgi:hypothetical protein